MGGDVGGRLRHLGARREEQVIDAGGQIQQIRDLLECVWPAALDTARQPFRSKTWVAALTVVLDRDGGDFARTRRLGVARFEHAVRREITRRGGQRPSLRILRNLYQALADPAGVLAHASARKHGVADDDMLHAFNHPIRYEDLDDGFVMIVGPARSARLIEVGFIDTDHGPVIVHAMTARRKYLR